MNIKKIREIMNIPEGEIGVPVCIIDSGTDTSKTPGAIAVNYDPAKQSERHGTCTGLVIHTLAGCQLHCFKLARKEAIRYCAENGIRIINFSRSSPLDFDDEEAELIRAHQIIFVAAVGNEGDKGVTYPAKNELTIAVAAYYGKKETIEKYSGRGPEVDVAAYTDWDIPLGRSTVTFTGTSAAAPVIAGCLSIYLKYHPGATIDECRDFLKVNSKDIGAPGLDIESGWGLFRFPNSDWRSEERIMKICIDPGHGGSDPGAVGPSGAREKDVVLAIAQKLADILKAAGAEVKLTRENDIDVSLQQRVIISNECDADIFLSIHANAATSAISKGMEVYTTVGQTAADKIAESISDSLQASFPGLVFRADVSDGDSDKEANFFVLYKTKAPAVLVELAFITNLDEEAMLKTKDYQAKAARAIAEGLTGHLGLALPEPTPADPTGEAIKTLQAAGILNTPEYWLAYARPGRQVSGEFVGLLIQNMAKKLEG